MVERDSNAAVETGILVRRSAIEIRRLEPADRPAWERLFRAYVAFCDRSLDAAAYTPGPGGSTTRWPRPGFIVYEIDL